MSCNPYKESPKHDLMCKDIDITMDISAQEGITGVTLAALLAVFAVFTHIMLGYHASGILDAPDAGVVIGRSTLALIAVAVVVTIVVQILAQIIRAVVTRDCDEIRLDERDRLIELKSMRTAFTCFSIGFIAAMNALAFEWMTPSLVLLALVSMMYLSSIIGEITKLVLYRRGA